jgi:hypothetical protein
MEGLTVPRVEGTEKNHVAEAEERIISHGASRYYDFLKNLNIIKYEYENVTLDCSGVDSSETEEQFLCCQ